MNTGIQDAWNLGWKLALVASGLADEALLDSYEAERGPIGRFVLRFTDRATSIATSDSRLVRLFRTQVVPRLAPLVLRFARARAYGFRTLAQLAHRLPAQPGRGRRRAGPPPGADGPAIGSPMRASSDDGQRVLATRGTGRAEFHLLLCGPRRPGTPTSSPRASATRRGRGAPPRPRSRGRRSARLDGQAFARLGVDARRSTSCGPTATSATAAAAPT